MPSNLPQIVQFSYYVLGKINKATTLISNFFVRDWYTNKEESPYKPDPVLLRGITIHLDL
jgi:hypothetical protein